MTSAASPKLIALAALALATQMEVCCAFAPIVSRPSILALSAEESKPAESVFLPTEPSESENEGSKAESIALDQVEMLGRGAAKVSEPK